jgi:hypothetical protein
MTSQTEFALRPGGYIASEPRSRIADSENDDLRTLLALHAIALDRMFA